MRNKKNNINKVMTKKELVRMLLANREITSIDEQDLIELLFNEAIAIDTDKQEDMKKTFGDRCADYISKMVGSWGFIILFVCFLVLWMSLNVSYLKNDGFDPYPFILLNLILSCVAALQAPVIMMSQNRQSKKDSLKNHNDYKIDLKSELILESLHDEITLLIKNQRQILNYIEEEKNKNASQKK